MAKILLVCTGNICRSPMAEGMLRQQLRERGIEGISVESAGISGWDGSAPMPEAIEAVGERGIDISEQRARLLDASMLDADAIIGMASEHREAILAAAPDSADRTFTLKELVKLLDGFPLPRGRAKPQDRLRHGVEWAARRRAREGMEGGDEDVADPLGLGVESYRAVAWEVDGLVETLLDELFGRGPDRRPSEVSGLGSNERGVP